MAAVRPHGPHRPGRRHGRRRAGHFLVALGALDLRFAPYRPYASLVTIGLGLIGLAWLERSRLLGVITGLFAASALLANLGVFAHYETAHAFKSSLLPGLILVAGGVVAWFHERGARA